MSRVPSLAEARRRAEATRRVKPDIEAPSGPAAIRALREAINTGKIPSTYVSGGRVVAVEKVSGTRGGRRGRRGLAAAGDGQRGPARRSWPRCSPSTPTPTGSAAARPKTGAPRPTRRRSPRRPRS